VELSIIVGSVVQAPKAQKLARAKEPSAMMISLEKHTLPLEVTSSALAVRQVTHLEQSLDTTRSPTWHVSCRGFVTTASIRVVHWRSMYGSLVA
jgi:hypothetical protein